MHNAIRYAVPLVWILLDGHLTVELIANANMMVNISKVQGKHVIRVH